jgi:hypothetical protein
MHLRLPGRRKVSPSNYTSRRRGKGPSEEEERLYLRPHVSGPHRKFRIYIRR